MISDWFRGHLFLVYADKNRQQMIHNVFMLDYLTRNWLDCCKKFLMQISLKSIY